LELGRISRASATQRAGRAGRTAPGRCVRLWSEREQRGLAEADAPEVARVDLASTVLALHAWGAPDPARFGWFEPPPGDRLAAAERLLVLLGALGESDHTLTDLGRRLLSVPAHPRIARLLTAAAADGHARTGAALAALLSEKDLVAYDPDRREGPALPKGRGSSDLLVRLDLLAEAERERFGPRLRARGIDPVAARRVARARDEMVRTARRLPGGRDDRGGEPDDYLMLRWLLLAYPDRVVRRRGNEATGVMVGGRGVRLEPA
jgi:ATP-dependent helicase HrpB